METMKHLLTQSVQRAGVAASVDATRVVSAAERVLGAIFTPAVAAHMKPLYLKNRTLTVSCSSTTVAQELKLRESDILAKLTETLGVSLVDRLRYFS